ncbi:hypothetical protein VOLCADRAFT_119573 [Volvox carteri f. nagariensis]|uniref:Uncharacterized protein n=1 Tax=Volvox carteri f. nagariensis TaxID=3068 RepID=D8UEC6_VOLCA|nr:uncharacterized protein VOLCADRAFT_119573 [Volvox carteri f. nagariensis]EFJ41945.1 hypothetical protein VOLCADRAFT_119573 [Volvox carteri f. nagariensis]|eukprot:XP_002956982.1 hypothetical protein VOLCADRAFT_119573 [Volvox carteri f. nagariensis]
MPCLFNTSSCPELRPRGGQLVAHASLSSEAACLRLTATDAAGAASGHVSPSPWADGDVLRLQLADGRYVYAEVLAGLPAPRTRQVPPSNPVGARREGSISPPQLLCQGIRYRVRTAAARGAAEAAASEAGSSSVQQESGGDGPPESLVLEAVGGALSPPAISTSSSGTSSSDPLRALLQLLQSPPRKHAAALRAWAPLASRLLRPPQLPQLTATASTSPAHQQQQPQPPAAQPLPAATAAAAAGSTLDGVRVAVVRRVMSLDELRGAAASHPGAWCDGSGPSDRGPAEDNLAVMTAGEVASLLEGRRGVVLLQLHIGWGAHEDVPPYGPYKPLVLRLLREALERPDIVSYVSSAPVPGSAVGNPSYGMTLVLCGDREPFRSWGAHLASFGCQAALEAQSPYYKLLIGRILGYREDSILHHIKEAHGPTALTPQVATAVEQQLGKLSAKKPTLPWNDTHWKGRNSRFGNRCF